MEKLNAIVNEAIGELPDSLSDEQVEAISKTVRAAVIKGLLEGQHRAVDACNQVNEAEKDTAHKIATHIRQQNDLLIVNLSSMR